MFLSIIGPERCVLGAKNERKRGGRVVGGGSGSEGGGITGTPREAGRGGVSR